MIAKMPLNASLGDSRGPLLTLDYHTRIPFEHIDLEPNWIKSRLHTLYILNVIDLDSPKFKHWV